jgi:hypothetical protein
MPDGATFDLDDALTISEPRILELHAYWQRIAAGRRMPSRKDFDPVAIPRLLPHLMLVDVQPGVRYRYRLIGTENVLEHGVDATGRYVDEVVPGLEYKEHVLKLYGECVRERRPVYSESEFLSPVGFRTERLLKVLFLPLSEDGETVNMVLVIQIFAFVGYAVRARHFLDTPPHREVVHNAL